MDLSPEEFDLEAYMAVMKAMLGSEVLGYWTLLSRDDAASFIESKVRRLQVVVIFRLIYFAD
jgi:hypothetical protein